MKSGMELKIKRIMLGIKANEIAQLLGVSNAYITYMEKGEKRISEDKYIKWTEFLGIKN